MRTMHIALSSHLLFASCPSALTLSMFDFQLYEALETYVKWFEYNGEELPLTALLVLLRQRRILVLISILSLCLTFDMVEAFLARLTNQVRFFNAFDRTQQN